MQPDGLHVRRQYTQLNAVEIYCGHAVHQLTALMVKDRHKNSWPTHFIFEP